MNWLSGLSDEDKKEMYEDSCAAYQSSSISMKQFILALAKLGYNATDIYEAEKFYRPSPPEGTENEADSG